VTCKSSHVIWITPEDMKLVSALSHFTLWAVVCRFAVCRRLANSYVMAVPFFMSEGGNFLCGKYSPPRAKYHIEKTSAWTTPTQHFSKTKIPSLPTPYLIFRPPPTDMEKMKQPITFNSARLISNHLLWCTSAII